EERLRPHRAEDMGLLGSVSASVRAGGGAPAPVEERLRPHRAEDMGLLGSVSASVRAGGGAPAPVEESYSGNAGDTADSEDNWSSHTHHAPESHGIRCIGCHMSAVNWRFITRRRDHTFHPPLPE